MWNSLPQNVVEAKTLRYFKKRLDTAFGIWRKGRISKFVDDTKIGRVVNSEVECLGLQEDMDEMVKWVDKWQMGFNPEKCEVMHFGRSNLTRKYTMQGLTLGTSEEQKGP